MANVVLKDNRGIPNTYVDVDTLKVPTANGNTENFYAVNGTRHILDTSEIDVAKYATAQVVSSDLVPENIIEGAIILGVVGTAPSGASDYEKLSNLPQINSIELIGNKSNSDLGLADIRVEADLQTEITNRTNADINLQNQISNRYTKVETEEKIEDLTLTKDNTSVFVPSADYQPATKKYVDEHVQTVIAYSTTEPLTNRPPIWCKY